MQRQLGWGLYLAFCLLGRSDPAGVHGQVPVLGPSL